MALFGRVLSEVPNVGYWVCVVSKSGKPSVFFYVQHLLGIGHLRRTELLCKEFSETGFSVTLVMGGRSFGKLNVGGTEIIRLPSLAVGSDGFHQLIDCNGSAVDEAWKCARSDQLCAAFEERSPNILITEAFPFGRRQMRFELNPLLEMAHSSKRRPLTVCSVRDILKSERKLGRAEETVDTISEFYDLVLVHGDPNFVRLENSFPLVSKISDKIRYTGIVAPSRNIASNIIRTGGVLVSAGGGAVGQALFEAALGARAMSQFSDHPWRFLVGPNLEWGTFDALRRAAPDGVIVERYRDDFRSLLLSCDVSVSQAGYNTVADILIAGTPAVFVAFDGDRENEQPRRARILEELGRAESLMMSGLTPERLAIAIDRAVTKGVVNSKFDLFGARASADILASAIA